MKHVLLKIFISLFCFSLIAAVAAGQQLDRELKQVQERWQEVTLSSATSEEKAAAYGSLLEQASSLANRQPDKPEVRLWEAIVAYSLATEAPMEKRHAPRAPYRAGAARTG